MQLQTILVVILPMHVPLLLLLPVTNSQSQSSDKYTVSGQSSMLLLCLTQQLPVCLAQFCRTVDLSACPMYLLLTQHSCKDTMFPGACAKPLVLEQWLAMMRSSRMWTSSKSSLF